MQPKKSDHQRSFLCPDLLGQPDPRNHLLGLAKAIPWNVFENNFRPLYTASGHPEKPVRLMDELIILKQLKNIAFPTDAKHLTKIVTQRHTMTKLKDVKLRRSNQRKIKSHLRAIQLKLQGREKNEPQHPGRRLRTIASIMVREMKRKLSPEALIIHQQVLDLYDREQRQQRSDASKIYSLHEPGTSCISKGNVHTKCEFSAKASVTKTKTGGIIVGDLSFLDNPFEGQTLPAALSQVESIVGQRPTIAIYERGYRGKRKIGVASIEIPESGKRTKKASDKRQATERFRRRAATEPIIGHLKNDHRMLHNYLKGQIGDSVNFFMDCAMFNLQKSIQILYYLHLRFLGHIFQPYAQAMQSCV